MKEVDRLEYLADIEDRFLTESWAECSVGQRKVYSPLKAAAILLVVLLAMGSAVYAATHIGAWISEKHTGHSGSGYTVKWDNRQVDMSELHGSVADMKDAIIEKYRNMDFENVDEMPGEYKKTFTSVPEAVDYIGYAPLVSAKWNYKPKTISVTLDAFVREGGRDVTPASVLMENTYEIDQIRLQDWKTIVLTDGGDAGAEGQSADGEVEYTQKKLKSKDGDEWLVVDSHYRTGKFMFYTKNAYFAHEGVGYSLYMVWQDDQKDKAVTREMRKRQETLMEEWINAYHF